MWMLDVTMEESLESDEGLSHAWDSFLKKCAAQLCFCSLTCMGLLGQRTFQAPILGEEWFLSETLIDATEGLLARASWDDSPCDSNSHQICHSN